MAKLLQYSLIAFLIMAAPKPGHAANVNNHDLYSNAVLKVFVTTNSMDYYRPWQSKGIKASGGSAAVIKGHIILTNAHVVADHTFIQVKKDADPKKYTAKVVAIGHDCDLALLEVEEEGFFDDITPLEFGDLPKLQDSVIVMGYPMGGGKISITEGVVSRMEVTSYAQSSRQLLAVQIDAAINPGNSGGPVLQDGKLVGIAMQVFQTGQNIGYMIPTVIVDHFLDDLDDGSYDGFPMLGIDFKNTENSTFRNFYGLDKVKGGVFVARVMPYAPASGIIQAGDVILEINGVPIGEDGTFKFRGEERLSMTHLITKEHIGDDISLKLMRDKKIQKAKLKLDTFVTLVPHAHYFKKPPYFVYGGLVFTVLSIDLAYSWGNRWWEKAPLDMVYYAIGTGRLNEEERKEIIMLLNILPDDINVGYHEITNEIVSMVNGKPVNSFEEFIKLTNDVKFTEPYTIFDTESKIKIIISNEDIDSVNDKILQRNNIPSQYSPDVGQWLTQAQ